MATDYSALGPWAGAAAAGYDRAHADKLQRDTQNALAGYGQDPDAAVKNFMAVDAPAAIGLQQQLTQQRAAQAAENRKRAYGAITGATDMLRSVRDKGGDVGAAYDQLDQGGILDTLGMSPQEKAHYRAAITANPGLIDVIGQRAAEGIVVAPGSQLMDKGTGRVLGSTPAVPKPLVVRRGDGGSDVIYPNAPGSDGAPMGGVPSIAAPVGNGSGTSRGDRNGNPGNLKDGPFARSQPGYLGSDGTFAKFSPGAGIAAQENLLQKRYFGRGINTVNGIVDTYLGSGNDENSVASRQNYKSYVAGRLGVDPNQPIPSTRLREFGQAMREFETGNTGGARRAPSAAPQSGVAYSTPGAPPKASGRMATPQDYQQFQLDQNVRYWINADGKPEAITGQDKSQGQQKPIPPQIVTKVVENRNAVRNVDKALEELSKYPDGVGPGTGYLGNWFTQLNDPKGNKVRAAIANIGSLIIHDRSGAAVTASETPRLQPFVPLVTDNAATVKDKLTRLRAEVSAINDDYELQYGPDQGYKPLVGGSEGPAAGAAPAAPSAASNAPGSSQQNPIPIRSAQDAIKNSGKWVKTPDGRIGRAK